MTMTAVLTGALALTLGGNATESRWQAGVATAVVTPRSPMWMAGYASRDRPAEGKLQDLYVKALALKDAKGERTVLVTSDLLGFPKILSDPIFESAQKKYGLPRANLALTSSHTHCGPVLRDSLKTAYPLDDAQRRLVERYSDELAHTVVALIGRALDDLAPATVSVGQGTCRFAVNRRENPEAKVPEIRAAGQLKGPIDHAAPVLVVKGPTGEPRAIVFGYACHNTTLSFYQWCGDYAGFAQEAIEARFPGAKAMFFMGCGGDQNPLPRRDVALCKKYGRELADEVIAVVERSTKPLRPRIEAASELIDLPYGPAPTAKELDSLAAGSGYQKRWVEAVRLILAENPPPPRVYPYPIAAWRLGGEQWWIFLGGEVVVDYALRFKNDLGPSAWIAGYSNDVMAYIPSKRVLNEGGYEGSTSMLGYGLPTLRWDESVEERVARGVARVVDHIKSSSKN